MNLHFALGDTYVFDNKTWEIVNIDNEDNEYPYECYPTEIVEKARKIAEKEDKTFSEVLLYDFVDFRECCSNFDVMNYKYQHSQKEVENLKAKIKLSTEEYNHESKTVQDVQEPIPNRLNRINAFKGNEEFLKAAAEQKAENEARELIKKIQALKPRIDELLATGNACLENGIAMTGQAWGGHEGYDTNQFFTNSWSHLVGFVGGSSKIEFLGINAGGACGPWNFRTDGIRVFSISAANTKEPEIDDMKKFLNKFDEFESAFYTYVDKVIDKQQKTVDSVIAEAAERTHDEHSTVFNKEMDML